MFVFSRILFFPNENLKFNQLFDIHVLNCQSTTKPLHFAKN
jgi:hypothetical protein